MRIKSKGGLTVANKTMKTPLSKIVRNPNKQNTLSKSNLEEAVKRGKNNKVNK